jgi:mannose/cellobiose epimerase-like protein (N-acyl-D-glucosamine 2-epimerase family)
MKIKRDSQNPLLLIGEDVSEEWRGGYLATSEQDAQAVLGGAIRPNCPVISASQAENGYGMEPGHWVDWP